jgi:hypothetical protein
LDHHDAVIPSISSLEELIERVNNLDQVFESKIFPNLMRLDTSPQEKLLEDWSAVLYLYDSLDDIPAESMKGFDTVVGEVRDSRR